MQKEPWEGGLWEGGEHTAPTPRGCGATGGRRSSAASWVSRWTLCSQRKASSVRVIGVNGFRKDALGTGASLGVSGHPRYS